LLLFSIASFVSCDNGARNYGLQATFAGAPQFRSVSFLDQSGAALVHEQHRHLRVTVDGGQTWKVIPATSVIDGFECVTLTRNNRLWAVSHEGRVFTSNYPGASWTEISNLRTAASGDFSGAKQIQMVNEAVGWILESLSIWHTKDGGITWTEVLSVLSPGVDGQPTGMFIINETTLLAIGTSQVFLTKDGGATWKIQTLRNKPDLRDVWFSDSENGWITGYTSGSKGISMVLFATKDGGESWKELPYSEPEVMPFSIYFVDNKGWISGHRYFEDGSRKPLLLHTDDGGANWSSVPIPHDDPFVGLIRFSNKSNGWLVSRDSLYRTEDGGKTWKRALALLPNG
jgi:photosystem II stability/assembly factor-like uncharacterized protein